MDYIYLLKEREFIKTGEDIFKIGRSSQFNDKRIKQYPKGSMVLLMIFCGNSKQIEIFLINKFKEIFIQRKDIGVEYFEGCLFKMREIIIENIIKLDNLTIEKFKQESLNKLNKINENFESIISEKKRIDDLNDLKIKSILEKENRKEEKKKKKELNIQIKMQKKIQKEMQKEIINKKKEEEKELKKEIKQNKKKEQLLFKKNKIEKIIENNNKIMKDFFNNFKLSDNINDYICSTDIINWFIEKNYKITMKKFGIEIKKYITEKNMKNIRSGLKSVNGIPKNVWFGIKNIS